jgi:hypothetical protein
VIDEFDQILGAAETACDIEENALARGDGLWITHGV